MLEGKTVQLRTVKEGDLAHLYACFDSIRMKGEFLSWELLSEYQFRLSFYETGFWTEEKGTVLVIHEERLAGAVWFEKRSGFDCLELFFYVFDEADRRKGLMTEGVKLFCSYLFATKKIVRLQISVPGYGKGALSVAQKSGFQFEGIIRSSFFHRGDYLDLFLYSLLRGECKEIEKISMGE